MRGSPRVWGLVLAGALAAPVAPQPSLLPEEIKALALAEEGQVTQAEALLRAAERHCPAKEAGSLCRKRLQATLGSLYQTHAGAFSASKEEDLGKAAGAYERLLTETPADGPAAEKLLSIYRQQKNYSAAALLLERAMKADPAAGEFALQRGDLFLDRKRIEDARRFYDLAAHAYPYDGAAAQRIVLTYRKESKGGAAELLGRGKGWEGSFPTAAREAYETVMQQSWKTAQSPSDPAVQALWRWTGLLARRGSISAHDLESLPSGWDSADIQELKAYLANPRLGIGVAPGWAASEDGRAALQWVALALGRERAEAGLWPEAEAVWHEAAGIPAAALRSSAQAELLIELASLYAAHPELDAGGAKRRGLEIETGPATSAEPSPRALQRYHATLGLLGGEPGPGSPDGSAARAIFHLAKAVEIADSARWEREGFYQPLARLRERLARAAAEDGKTEEARARALAACRADLDTDDLAGAARSLERIPGNPAEADYLRRALAVRQALDQDPAAPEGLAAFLQAPAPETSAPAPQRGFDRRQRFKVLADLAGEDAAAGSLENARRALELALDKDFTLVGAGDLLRLKKVQRIVLRALGLDSAEPEVVPAVPDDARNRSLHRLSLPTDLGPAWVRVSPDVDTAARIVSALGEETVLRARPELRIQAGSAILYRSGSGLDLKVLAARLAKAGIKATVAGPS